METALRNLYIRQDDGAADGGRDVPCQPHIRSYKLAAQPQSIDLAKSPSSNVVLELTSLSGSTIQGTITGKESEWLPFAWLIGTYGESFQADLISGNWAIQNVQSDGSTWTANAPGFYSRKITITKAFMEEPNIVLQRRPETIVLPWGEGKIIIPPETKAQASDGRVQFESGWLWGENPGREPVVLETYQAVIRVDGGHFALQRLPGGVAWFHLFDGSAELLSIGDGKTLKLSPGEMVALSESNGMQATPYSSGIAQIVEGDGYSPISPVWKPG